MRQARPATPREALAFGLLTVGIGLYFSLVGLGLLPIPGGPRNLHAPLWVVLCCGLAFLLGGVALLLQRAGGASLETGELPPGAPYWVRLGQYLVGVAIFACFALVASWIAFGPGERTFSGTVPTGATLGRIVFGIGAILCWLATIAFAVSGARKLRRAREAVATPPPERASADVARDRLRILYALGNKPK
jgi:hypothetical protein